MLSAVSRGDNKMVLVDKTDKIAKDTNLSRNQTILYIQQLNTARQLSCAWSVAVPIHWEDYNIKETDMRIKTATFKSPQSLDLTNGQYAILMTTPLHEDFSGVIIGMDYDKKNDEYSFQCQDWSRKLMGEQAGYTEGIKVYNYLQYLITNCAVSFPVATAEELKEWKNVLSGLRPKDYYADSNFGGKTNFNRMDNQLFIQYKGEKKIDLIRDVLFSGSQYWDIYFDKYGVLQIERYHGEAYRKSGVEIDPREISEIKIKFDISNVITRTVHYDLQPFNYTEYSSPLLVELFGRLEKVYENPKNEENDSNTKSTTASATSNPYGNKAKKIWINSDNGSGNMKNAIANVLKQKGWEVHVGRTCSNCHYEDYFNVTSDYQVYATLYNGFCAGTVREAYSSSIQNTLKKKGVVLVIMWDTSGWTNPQGMQPYRYGDFSGYNAGRAWDDNFSSSDPSIKNVSQWLKNNNAIYCANPSAEGIVEQFLAGGYFKSKGM